MMKVNKSIARNIDTDHIPIQHLCSLLETFALKHSSKQLPDILEEAENAELTYRQFLLELLEIEVKGRNERRRKRNYSAAHFPPHPRRLEEFDPGEL
jgi:DNA replication protein DnaC